MGGPPERDRSQRLARLVRTVPPFVDRTQELAWLTHLLQEAVAGHPRVILITGEAGIGKTRLLEEMRSGALRHGIQVCYGRCHEDLILPYLPFVEVLRPLLEQVPRDMRRVLGADLEVINQLLHQRGIPSPAANPPAHAQTDDDKLRLFLTVSRLTIMLARRSPALFIVDDLHWADRPSLDLFAHLVFTVADTAMQEPVPLLLIGTMRPVAPEEHLARLIARLQKEDICQTLEIGGLNDLETHDLIQGIGLVRPSHQLIATVSEATQGNPLFIQEVLHHLVQHDALQERGGYVVTTAAPSDLPLPDQVTSAIAVRMRGLSEDCRRMLTLASCLGDRFSLQVLAAVSGMEEDILLSLLEEGIRQHLLRSEGQTFQFAHPLIRHVFYHEPSAARRQRLHQRIAQTLERLYVGSLEVHTLEIAHHLVRAGPAAEAARVIAYARRAGDQAFAMFAWGDAARYYEAALAAAEASGRLSPQDRAELHYLAGLAHYRDQDVGPCLDHYDEAIAAYRSTGDLRGLGQALMEKTRTHYTLASVPYGTLIDIRPLEDVLTALGEREPALRGRIAAVISEVYWTARQTAKAEETAQQALEIGERLQDDRLCANAGFALGLAYGQSLHMREALESWQRALTYARRSDDFWLQSWPLQRMPLALMCLGRLDEAEAVAQEACDVSRKTQEWGYYSVPLSHLASVAVAHGDFAAVERWAHETLLMVSRSGYPYGGARALLALACARGLRGAWTEAEDALDLLVEPGGVFRAAGPVLQTFVRVFRQLLRAQSGTVEEALEPLITDLLRVVIMDSYSLAPLCAVVELGELLAAPAMAEQASQALSAAVERGALFSHGWVFLLPRVLGLAATLQRQWDAAEAHFQSAIDAATHVGARPELACTHLDYARMLVARGGRGARRQAITFVRQAAPMFHELGMAPFARRAAELAEALRTRVLETPRPHAAYPNRLSEREVEILRYVAQGHTNQEIADSLVLGSHTVARHIRSIFKKIGVKNRTGAVAFAFEQQLAPQPQPHSGPGTTSARDRVRGEGLVQTLHILLVTDMEGSTSLIQHWGDAQAHELLRVHNAIIRQGLRRHHGTEIMHTGDGVEASFPSASSAVAAAVAIQQAFARHDREHPEQRIRVRIGIHAGEPILTEGRLFGTAVHTTFRICARARPGQILVSDVVRQLAAGSGFAFVDRGRVTLKGLSGRFRLYEVRWAGAQA